VSFRKDVAQFRKDVAQFRKDVAQFRKNVAQFRKNVAQFRKDVAQLVKKHANSTKTPTFITNNKHLSLYNALNLSGLSESATFLRKFIRQNLICLNFISFENLSNSDIVRYSFRINVAQLVKKHANSTKTPTFITNNKHLSLYNALNLSGLSESATFLRKQIYFKQRKN